MKRVISVNKIEKCTIGLVQRYYMSFRMNEEYMERTLIPDTILINEDQEIILKINSDGFKGDDIPPDSKLIFVWGDSCVFGTGVSSWVEKVHIPGYHIVNGGVEGNYILGVRDMMAVAHKKFRKRISAHFFYGSWHPLYKKYNQEMWSKAYENVRKISTSTLLATMPSPMNELSFRDFRALLPSEEQTGNSDELDPLGLFVDDNKLGKKNNKDKKSFRSFLGDRAFTIEQYNLVKNNLMRLNDYIRKIAFQNKIPLVDLANKFRPDKQEKYPEFFFDAIHPDPSKYDDLGHIVQKEIQNIL